MEDGIQSGQFQPIFATDVPVTVFLYSVTIFKYKKIIINQPTTFLVSQPEDDIQVKIAIFPKENFR